MVVSMMDWYRSWGESVVLEAAILGRLGGSMPVKSLTMLVGSEYILSDQDGVREWNATCTCCTQA